MLIHLWGYGSNLGILLRWLDDIFQEDYNYAVLSGDLPKEEDREAFLENLELQDFIVKKEVRGLIYIDP